MSNPLSSILVNIDTYSGSTAVDYSPGATGCPILGFQCIGSSGSGNVKLTPLSSTYVRIGATSGSGGRLRVKTNGSGAITTVEVGASGSGYPNNLTITLEDPYGSGAVIACTASGGMLSTTQIVSAGSGYSGYVLFDVNDFIEGVVYNIVPRHIEQTSGTGVLQLMGFKLPYKPFQIL